MKLKTLFNYYLNQHVKAEKITGIQTATSNINNLKLFFKNKDVKSLTRSDIRKYRDYRWQTVGNASIRRELSVLLKCLNLGVDEFDLNEDFVHDLRINKFKPKVEARKIYPQENEIKLLLKNLPVYYRRMFFAAWRLGLRPRSEVRKLKFKHLDLNQGLIQMQHSNGDFKIKNKRSFALPLDENMVIFFKNLEREAKRIFGEEILNVYIFRNRWNKKIQACSIYRSFRTAQFQAGLVDENGKWLYRPHDFRKSAAKYLLHVKRLPQKYVTRFFTNHIDESTFSKHYDISDESDFDHAMMLIRS